MKKRNKTSKEFPFREVNGSVGGLTIGVMFLLVSLARTVQAQDLSSPRKGTLIVPASSIVRPEDAGKRAHTNYEIFLPADTRPLTNKGQAPSGLKTPGLCSSSPPSGVETPASLACIYGLVQEPNNVLPGCQITDPSLVNPSGGSGMIVIVEPYDDPTASSDLQMFSTCYGLPRPPNFLQIYANGTSTPPPTNFYWEEEESLEIEWAHAMAPNATIVLVEAQSNSMPDLLAAEAVATNLFAGGIRFCEVGLYCPGPGEISNGWSFAEFSTEVSDDVYFEPPPIICEDRFLCGGGFDGLVIFAVAGDDLGVNWPGVSPWVVAAGGTTINRDASSGKFIRESTWYNPSCPPLYMPCGGGGGPSNQLEAIPTWQASLNSVLKGWRGTPDLSFDANPASGVAVFYANNWIPASIGGTALSSAALAGIVNSAGNFYGSGAVGQGYIPENALLYSEMGGAVTYPAYFKDIRSGKPGTNQCGQSGQYGAGYGWDFCTGLGTPLTLLGK